MTIEEDNIEFSKLKSEMSQKATLKECFLKDTITECSTKIINAHSLQRMGSLSVLETEVNGNQNVYALTETQINPKSGLLELLPIGKKAASTFFGFCQHHDTRIFEPIEQHPELINLNSIEHCFLLSFRAFAISYHRKKEDINLFSIQDEAFRIRLKRYLNIYNLQEYLEGLIIGLKDMEPNKKILVDALYSKDYSCLDFFVYELDYTAPVAMCMLTTPPFLFSGKPINTSEDPEYQFSDIITSVIPLKSRTLIIFAAFKKEPWGCIYLDELNQMHDIQLQKALTWHILTTSENCFFSPAWYDKLNNRQKQDIIDLYDYASDVNTPFLKYNPSSFNLNLFDPKYSLTIDKI